MSHNLDNAPRAALPRGGNGRDGREGREGREGRKGRNARAAAAAAAASAAATIRRMTASVGFQEKARSSWLKRGESRQESCEPRPRGKGRGMRFLVGTVEQRSIAP